MVTSLISGQRWALYTQSLFSQFCEYIPRWSNLSSRKLPRSLSLSLSVLPGTLTLFISSPPNRALTHGPLTLAGSLPGGDHLKTSSSSLLPPTPSTLLPRSHNPSCDKQVPVRGLNSDLLKNIEDRKQGCRAPEIADVGGADTLSTRLWEALKDALSFQGKLVRCCLLNSITSHFKSELLQTVLYKHTSRSNFSLQMFSSVDVLFSLNGVRVL